MMQNVIIPAYKPDERLVKLVAELAPSYNVVVVDDGGGAPFAAVFDMARAAGATVLTHEVNKGKGAAIKTAVKYLLDANDTAGAITADADGQHSKADIDKLASRMDKATFILGGRDFSKMPPRSKFGNTVTRFVFRLVTGLKISDTQTGLRAFPASLYEKLLAVEGERYEYEMNVLLALRSWDVPYAELPIETIYIDDNSSSHFHPVLDGLRVFSRVIKYALSSIACFVLDYGLYCLLLWTGLSATWSYAAARVVSGAVNYQLCRRVVFKGRASVQSAVAYIALAVCCMAIGSAGVTLLSQVGVNSVLAKLLLDSCLFVMNYLIQKKFIFKTKAA